MGLDRNGYKRKTYDDLLNDMSAKAKNMFGENANVSERSVLGIILRIMSWFLSLAWEDNEKVYYSAYRKTAEGAQLDMLLPYSGITRNLAEYAFGEIIITGTPYYTVESGFLVETETEIVFETTEDITLDNDGLGLAPIVATEYGSKGNVAPNTIKVIVNPSADVESVNNPTATSGGREKETDQESRDRADISVEGLGSGTTSSIRTRLLQIPSVRAANVIDNHSDDTDEYGTPSRAIQAFVLGGSDEDIANAIFEKKAGGIQPYGQTYVTIKDISGNEQQVGFTRAIEVPIYIKVDVNTNNAFPIDGDEQIKSAIVRYIGGADADSVMYAGLNMGEDVIVSRLIARIYAVDGIEDVIIKLSTDGMNYDEINVEIALQEVAQTNVDHIEVALNV